MHLKLFSGPESYQEFRETGPSSDSGSVQKREGISMFMVNLDRATS